jgi:endo-beta-N-acetylglucosaminidase D
MQVIPFLDFDTSKTPAQMAKSDGTKPQITFWQYMQRITYFGGSQGEGQVLAPEPGWIKAAHQNGTQILGSIFFSPTAYGGDKELTALNNMLNNPSFYITQLVSIAKTLGFDGYFINNEADTSPATNNKFENFIQLFHKEALKQKVDLSLDWYQIPAFSGASLNKNLFVDSSGNTVSDNVFLDYGWTSRANNISSTVASWNYPLSQLDFGIYDVNYPVGSAHQTLYDTLFPTNKAELGSVSEFAFEEILNPTHSKTALNEQLLNETSFWLGTSNWKGASLYVSKTTPITALPFSTSFNTGQGDHYFINGIDTQLGAWHDMGQQDLLPTSRFEIMNENGNTITTHFDYSDSYMGGSHLFIQGTISSGAKTIIHLYDTHFDLSDFLDPLQLNTIYKANDTAKIQLCLHMTDNTQSCFALNPASVWKKSSHNLNLKNKIIDSILLDITGTKSEPSPFSMQLGHIFIGSTDESMPPNPPEHAKVISHDKDENGKTHYYLTWDRSPNALYYYIYADGHFVGRTHQTIFDVITDSSVSEITVSAVNRNAIESDKKSIF